MEQQIRKIYEYVWTFLSWYNRNININLIISDYNNFFSLFFYIFFVIINFDILTILNKLTQTQNKMINTSNNSNNKASIINTNNNTSTTSNASKKPVMNKEK